MDLSFVFVFVFDEKQKSTFVCNRNDQIKTGTLMTQKRKGTLAELKSENR